VLGVGSGNVFTNLAYQGVATERPLRKMTEYVELLRQIVSAVPGKPVDYVGEVHSMQAWFPQAEPVRPSIPIYLAALFPKMRRVAGRVADGVAIGALQSVDHLAADVVPAVRGSAVEAGRRPDEVGVMMAAFVSVAGDREEAVDAARHGIVNLFAPKPHLHYEHTLRDQGFGAVLDQVLGRLQAEDHPGAVAAVPDELVDRLTVSGTPAECVARIDEYRPHVDEILLVNARGARHRREPTDRAEEESLLEGYHAMVELAGLAATARSSDGR
jgi:alkanesulfonate monooxygenase SsuD/methylene tetrahydromethanopterin reductase-like flavin-dependent oxidoreductase (luciferase family)